MTESPLRPGPPSLAPRTLTRLMWVVALGLGALDAWTGRHDLDDDALAYLDLADAFMRGDWDTAINAYWSPLYPALLALFKLVLRAPPRQEILLVELVNVVIFVATLFAFHFFLRQVIAHRRSRQAAGEGSASGLPETALIVSGYALAIWATVRLVTVSVATPDLCSHALLLLASGLLLRIRTRPSAWPTYAALGVALGLAYLAKAAVFPIAFLFLAAAVVWTAERRWAVQRGLVALTAFAAVSAPLVALLSRSEGHLTFGESGRLNYAWYVAGNGFQRNWQGGTPELGIAAHPTRQLLADPPVFEFAGPIGGTYPVWLDPAYWNRGIGTPFSLKKQIIALAKSVQVYARLFAGISGLIVILLVVMYAGGRLSGSAREAAEYAPLIIPSVAAFAMYALVHVEPRFLGSYLIIIGVCLLASMRLPEGPWSKRLYEGIAIACLVVSLLPTAWGVAYSVTRDFLRPDDVRQEEYIADGLARLGLEPGDPVGTVGFGAGAWTRLARVQVIVEVPWGQGPAFWNADPRIAEQALALFRSAGAKVALADNVPASRSEGWVRIERTTHFYRILR